MSNKRNFIPSLVFAALLIVCLIFLISLIERKDTAHEYDYSLLMKYYAMDIFTEVENNNRDIKEAVGITAWKKTDGKLKKIYFNPDTSVWKNPMGDRKLPLMVAEIDEGENSFWIIYHLGLYVTRETPSPSLSQETLHIPPKDWILLEPGVTR